MEFTPADISMMGIVFAATGVIGFIGAIVLPILFQTGRVLLYVLLIAVALLYFTGNTDLLESTAKLAQLQVTSFYAAQSQLIGGYLDQASINEYKSEKFVLTAIVGLVAGASTIALKKKRG